MDVDLAVDTDNTEQLHELEDNKVLEVEESEVKEEEESKVRYEQLVVFVHCHFLHVWVLNKYLHMELYINGVLQY